jgi:hypothetical protein
MARKPVTSNWWWIFPRIVILQVLFITLHYAVDWFPSSIFFRIISAVDESNFQHWKIATMSFILLSLIEIPLSIGELKNDWWWFGRLSSTLFITFIIFVLYYIPFMFLDSFTILFEVIFANVILLVSNFSVSILEWQFREKEVHIGVKIVLLVLFVVLIAEFIIFTFDVPFYDVFADPLAP